MIISFQMDMSHADFLWRLLVQGNYGEERSNAAFQTYI